MGGNPSSRGGRNGAGRAVFPFLPVAGFRRARAAAPFRRQPQPFWHLIVVAVASWQTGWSAWQYCRQTASVRHSPTAEKPCTPASGTTRYDGQSPSLVALPAQLANRRARQHHPARPALARRQVRNGDGVTAAIPRSSGRAPPRTGTVGTLPRSHSRRLLRVGSR